MSLKIYNGYTLPMMSLQELNSFTSHFREKVRDATKHDIEGMLGTKICSMIDDLLVLDERKFVRKYTRDTEENHTKYEDIPQNRPLNIVYESILERYQHIQRTNIRDSEVDFDSNAVFIPLAHKILVLFYAELPQYTKLWERQEEVKQYHYWNHTDRDEECSDEEWEQRKADWAVAFSLSSVPSDNGIIAEFVKGLPSKFDLSLERIVSRMPSLNERSMRIAKRLVTDWKAIQQKAELMRELNVHDFIAITEWLETQDGKEELRQVANRISNDLIPDMTEELLTMPLHKIKEMQNENA